MLAFALFIEAVQAFIPARSASLEEANVEHDALVAELEQARDEEIAVAYRDMLACLQPEQSVSMAKP